MALGPLDAAALNRSILHAGRVELLAPLMQRLRAGEPISIAGLGASVMAAGGCLTQPTKRCMDYSRPPNAGFLVRLLRAVNRSYPHAGHRIYNGAADATPAALIAECLYTHIPRNPSLVVLEFGSMAISTSQRDYNHVESIVRALLVAEPPPAIVFLTVRQLGHHRDKASPTRQLKLYPRDHPTFWSRAEAAFSRICERYGASCLSYYSAIAPHLYAQPPTLTLADVALDGLHPEKGRIGTAALTSILLHWLSRAELATSAYAADDDPAAGGGGGGGGAAASRPRVLPPPLREGFKPAGQGRCYGLGRLRASGVYRAYARLTAVAWRTASCGSEAIAVPATPLEACSHVDKVLDCPAMDTFRPGEQHAGGDAADAAPPPVWVYCYAAFRKGRRGSKRAPGALGFAPGATLDLPLDTRWGQGQGSGGSAGASGGSQRAAAASSAASHGAVRMRVTLGYLTSYMNMGIAAVSCVRGCACDEGRIDAHHVDDDRNVSVLTMHSFALREPTDECVVRLRLLNETSSGGHKFKLMRVTVNGASEE